MPKQNTAVLKAAQLQVVSDLAVLPTVVEWFEQFQGMAIAPFHLVTGQYGVD